jgi:hypothetical protein
MSDSTLDRFDQNTAKDILKRYAPDCFDRAGLRDAIARLARQGIESSIRLYQMQQQTTPAEKGDRKMPQNIADKMDTENQTHSEKQRTARRARHYFLVAGNSSAWPSSAIDKQLRTRLYDCSKIAYR